MNQKKYTEVALIILGLYAFIRGLNGFFNYFSVKIFFSWSYLPLFIPTIIFWIMAGLLFWYTPTISSYLFDSDETPENIETLQIHEWYRLAFSIIGILLLFWIVLPGLLHGTGALLFPPDLKDPDNNKFGFFKSQKNLYERQVFGFLGNLVEGGIAIYLIRRAKQLAAFIVKWQNPEPTVSSENLGK